MTGILLRILLILCVCAPSAASTGDFLICCKYGYTEDASAMLQDDPGLVDIKGPGGDTPLHYAVENTHEPVVRLLLGYGADPDVQNEKGQTPLHLAVMNFYPGPECISMVSRLLECGADVNITDKENLSPLDYALEICGKGAVEMLVEYGAVSFQNHPDDPDGVVCLGVKQAPHVFRRVEPVWPPICSRARIQGSVLLRIVNDEYGHVQNIRVLSGHPLVKNAIVKAVKKWLFEVVVIDGHPRKARFVLKINFRF